MTHNERTARRRRAIVRRLRRAKLEALLVTKPENVRYLSGFTGEDSWLLVARGRSVLITDGRFAEQAEREAPDVELKLREDGMVATTADLLRHGDLGRAGFEPGSMSVLTHAALREKLRRRDRLEAVEGWVEKLRAVKDAGEVEAIRRSLRIAERSWRETVREALEAGRTERFLAGHLEWTMRRRGADGTAFDTICAAGAHASLPHARPGGRKARPGDAVLFDWGARRDGYNCDLTRVVALDRMPPEIRAIYGVVLSAQRRAIDAVAPGVRCSEVDRAARSWITAKGYGEAFGHGTGHGVGLEIHEAPSFKARSAGRLRAGMVVTIEPGIYLPGVGGVRIEDMVLVTKDGHEVLSRLGKSPGRVELRREGS
jgi:Xaa-Pro aminopeptidase